MSDTPVAAKTRWVRRLLKSAAHAAAVFIVAPAGAAAWIERKCSRESESVFTFFAQSVALIPGFPGVCVRRAYYALTLEDCSRDFHIGLGSLFTHRDAVVERGVYIGGFTSIGCARLRRGCLIGSHVSLLSGPSLHEADPIAGWLPSDPARLQNIEIGAQAWIGERAVVMSDVGSRAMIAAGAVVSAPVPPGLMVAGNPARFVKRVHVDTSATSKEPVRSAS